MAKKTAIPKKKIEVTKPDGKVISLTPKDLDKKGRPIPVSVPNKRLCLHLGCGDIIIPSNDRDEWVNVDAFHPSAQLKADAKNLFMFGEESVDEIYTCHLLEHFNFIEREGVLGEWKRVLKPGGILVIELPDLLATCRKFLELPPERHYEYYSHLHGEPWTPGNTHLFMYTEFQLASDLHKMGFHNIQKMPALRYIGREDVCMKFACTK